MKLVISHYPGEEILYCGGLLYQEDPVFVIYLTVSDLDEPFYISKQFMLDSIAKSSKLLGFQYEYVYSGRSLYGKLDILPQLKIEYLLHKRLKFLNPTDIYFPVDEYDSSNIKLYNAIMKLANTSWTNLNLFSFGNDRGNYLYKLSPKASKAKSRALLSFGEIAPVSVKNETLWSYEDYNLIRYYNENIDFAEPEQDSGSN